MKTWSETKASLKHDKASSSQLKLNGFNEEMLLEMDMDELNSLGYLEFN